MSLEEEDIDTVCKILQTLQDVDRYEKFKRLAVDLAMKHLKSLRNERFRYQVFNNQRVMFKLVERLSFAADLVPIGWACEKHDRKVYAQKICR